MTKRQRGYLLSLANFLEKLPENNWDQEQFDPYVGMAGPHPDMERRNVGIAGPYPDIMERRNEALLEPSSSPRCEVECGTACCVAGWAAILHRKAWPKITILEGEILDINEDSFQNFFGLSAKDAYLICLEDMDFTSIQKADQIRHLVDCIDTDGMP